MKTIVLIILTIIGFIVAASNAAADASGAVIDNNKAKAYKVQSDRVLAAIDKGDPAAVISYESEALMAAGESLAFEFTSKHKECSGYLAVAMDGVTRLGSMSLEQIEKDYHLDFEI